MHGAAYEGDHKQFEARTQRHASPLASVFSRVSPTRTVRCPRPPPTCPPLDPASKQQSDS